MDGGLCCVVVAVLVGALLWAWADSRDKKADSRDKKKARTGQPGTQVVAARSSALPDWPLTRSIEIAEQWIHAVGASAQQAYEIGAAVPIDEVRGYLDRSGQITWRISRKLHAIRASDAAELHHLPREAQDYLRRDDEDLIRLSGTLRSLRDSLTNLIAGSDVDQSRKVHELENDVHALRQALQRFER